jgi:hypothetical protein
MQQQPDNRHRFHPNKGVYSTTKKEQIEDKNYEDIFDQIATEKSSEPMVNIIAQPFWISLHNYTVDLV